ncbi:hypothetical protein C2857_002267 [Epichloe festucae Fl1]|uniref:Uncharacterized protein n=1 Tax=Epichloe festucae (strain Fl1) TaxID=877507 RepID=A0A7S9KK63_EPIFF|nr:hypothetical protein C2857_002267 [Epichloe festucae Fl1]
MPFEADFLMPRVWGRWRRPGLLAKPTRYTRLVSRFFQYPPSVRDLLTPGGSNFTVTSKRGIKYQGDSCNERGSKHHITSNAMDGSETKRNMVLYDSGANIHIFNNSRWFKQSKFDDTIVTEVRAGGTTYVASGQGPVHISVTDPVSRI